MRAFLQRVRPARVLVDGAVVGAIDHGLLVLLGVGKDDAPAAIAPMLEKIVNLRIFGNDDGKFDRSLLDVGGGLLVVSQFTLYADVSRGRRPAFDGAMRSDAANAIYESFLAAARARLPEGRVAAGRFGAHMQVESTNDGPVSIWLDP